MGEITTVENKPAKHPGGRPTKYKPEYADKVYKLCLLGLTDNGLAAALDVDVATVNNWKKEHPEFFESIKKGKEIADAHIADKLYNRASGYSHAEDKIFVHDGQPVIVPTIKHYPPDTAAAIFWLKNRQPQLWRDKVETEISGPNGQPLQVQAIQQLPDADLDHMMEILSKSQLQLPE